jgi:hypothetical protein
MGVGKGNTDEEGSVTVAGEVHAFYPFAGFGVVNFDGQIQFIDIVSSSYIKSKTKFTQKTPNISLSLFPINSPPPKFPLNPFHLLPPATTINAPTNTTPC